MIVLVTGANGFVGRAGVRSLAAAGFAVRAAARSELHDLPQGASWARAPELDPGVTDDDDGNWFGILDGVDAVVHCAARVHVMQDESQDPLTEYRRINRDGTLALAQAAAKVGVRRMVFISSIKVNGEQAEPEAPYSRQSLPRPVDPYGISKMEAEQGLLNISELGGMDVTIIRPVLVYGPGVRANFRTLMRLVDRRVPLPLKTIDNRRSMIFVDNLADLVRHAITHPEAANRHFLASDGEDLSTAGLIESLANALGKPARLFAFPLGLMKLAARIGGREHIAQRVFGSLAVDCQETRNLLEWVPPFTVAEGIKQTTDAYRVESASSL